MLRGGPIPFPALGARPADEASDGIQLLLLATNKGPPRSLSPQTRDHRLATHGTTEGPPPPVVHPFYLGTKEVPGCSRRYQWSKYEQKCAGGLVAEKGCAG